MWPSRQWACFQISDNNTGSGFKCHWNQWKDSETLPKALDWTHGMLDPIWAYSLPPAVLGAEKQKEGTTEDSNYIAQLQGPATGQPGYETPSIWPLFCWRTMCFSNPYLELLRTGRTMPSHFKPLATQFQNTDKFITPTTQLWFHFQNSPPQKLCKSYVSLKSVMTDNIRS